nr:MAG: replication associated protein [Cressdnaviricota sp.]
MSRSRNFIFTINNYTPEDEQSVADIECKWIIAGKEVAPTTGTPHLQCAIVVSSPTSIRALSKRLPRAAIRVMDGTPEQSRTYCSKSDTAPYERGVCPISNVEKGNKEKRRWADAFSAVQENRLDDVPKDILCTKLKSVEYAVQRVKQTKTDLSTLTEWLHEWRYGETGTGKSETARADNPGAYIKDPTKDWWDGYNGEEVVIIEDFDKYQVKQGGDMKRWLDKYPFQAPIKGGYLLIRPKKIVVTSNYRVEEIWSDEQTVGPILRRVKVIHHVPWLISGSSGGSKSK